MELHYLDNQNDFLRSTANGLSGLSAQLPYLRATAEKLRQERVMEQARAILYGEQTRQATARTKLYESQTAATDQRTEQGRKISQALIDAGAARADINRIQRNPATLNPLLSVSPAALAQALGPIAIQREAMDKDLSDYIKATTIAAGSNPQRAQEAIRGTMIDYGSGLANNAQLAQAALLRSPLEHNIPANNVSLNAATGGITPGSVSVPAAGLVQMPGQLPVLGQLRPPNQLSPDVFLDRSALNAAVRAGAAAAAKVWDTREEEHPGSRNAAFTNAFQNTYLGIKRAWDQAHSTNAPPPGAVETNAQRILNRARTQSLGGTNAPVMPSVSGLPSSKRIRVQSKDGRTGTMDANEPLPQGWQIVPDPATDAPQKFGLPAVGEIRSGYRFKGGDPADQNSWEAVSKASF